MDDPIHANESRFWDLVTDWLVIGCDVSPRAAGHGSLFGNVEPPHAAAPERARREPDPN